MPQRLAVDIGGTFIDIVTIDPDTGELIVEKEHSTPDELASSVVRGIEKSGVPLEGVQSLVHGTTLGVNAVLEREGATVGIVTNEGFRDVFEMGRYDVPDEKLYDFLYDKPEPLVPRRRRIGVPGRVDADGEVVEPLDETAVRNAARTLVEEYDVESIVVAFLHSYTNSDHERRAAEVVEEACPGVSTSVSSEIVREHYEYERTSTAVLDAYIKPTFDRYVDKLHDGLSEHGFDGNLLITRSGGGALPVEGATDYPVHTILSGPAGGIVGASQVARLTDRDDLITFDMGGTSLETSVIEDGTPTVQFESSLEHLPMMIPVYDIRTIGAGGGSVAWTDGTLLKVGPDSAGAVPGPICYDRGGTDPTITDAAVSLGYIRPDAFLGGELELDRDGAVEGIRRAVGEPLGMDTNEASKGILQVTVNKHVGTIREITVERGLDPREFSMLAFGGAGPLLAPLVARELGAAEVVIPRAPAVFSAWGMLMVDVVHDFSTTRLTLLPDTEFADIDADFVELEDEAIATLDDEGYGSDARKLVRSLEMRYMGQEQTVEVEANDAKSLDEISDRFEANHRDRYGHTLDDPIEIVYQRMRGVGLNDKPTVQRYDATVETDPEPIDTTLTYCFATEEEQPFDVYERGSLDPGHRIRGPAVIGEPTSTTVIHSDQHATVDEFDQIVVGGESDV